MKNLLIIVSLLILVSCCPLKKSKEEVTEDTKTTKTTSEMKTPTIEDLQDKTWYWVNTKLNDGTTISPKEKSSYIIFEKDNKLNIKSDCNNGSSTFKLDGKSFTINPIMSTKKYCQNSNEKDFFNGLMSAYSVFTKDARLFIELKMDTGTMEFVLE